MFTLTTSASGALHSSQAEAKAADRLAEHGIVPYDMPLPVTYSDKEGTSLQGRADFADLTLGICFEWKPRDLNGRKSKASADKAMARHEQQVARGFITPGSRGDDFGRLSCQFNHSAYCVAAKQQAMHDAGHVLVLLLGKAPEGATRRRLERQDILWLVEGSPQFKQFNSMRKLATVPGISATARVGDWQVKLS
jgi:hypothetical protein